MWAQAHTEERPCRYPEKSATCKPRGGGGVAQKKPTLPTCWSPVSNLQDCKKVNVCCWSHTIYGTLSWRSLQSDTHTLFCLAAFTQYNYAVVRTHSLFSFIATFHHMNIQFVCPFTTDESLDYFSFWLLWTKLLWTLVYKSSWTHAFISF